MIVREYVPLSVLTTFRAGGPARFVLTCSSTSDVEEALAFAASRNLSWRVLGSGSNILAADQGYEGVVIQPLLEGIRYEQQGDTHLLTAGAGVAWEAVVDEAASRGLWGVENLAGIPGTIGAAPVQNIGAYGVELAHTLRYVEAFDTKRRDIVCLSKDVCAFGYRESIFKQSARHIILSVALEFQANASPSLTYHDLVRAKEAGVDLSTPRAVGNAVRAIRAKKFPDLSKEGTAGSFFKNPIITKEACAKLAAAYPDLPQYPFGKNVKVPLAFILDRILGMRGLRLGAARLYEVQPLVLVLDAGGTAADVEALARVVEENVFTATGIRIEREVQSLG